MQFIFRLVCIVDTALLLLILGMVARVLPKSAYCSHTLLLLMCPTNESHNYFNLVIMKATFLNLMTHLLKTSSVTSVELFTVCAVALSLINDWFFSSVTWFEEGSQNQFHVMFRIYCFMKNMGLVILCTNCTSNLSFKSCNGTLWKAWGVSLVQYLLFLLFT